MSNHLAGIPVYAIYAALESGALLALLPELDRWHGRLMQDLRLASQADADAPEQDAAVYEQLNEARSAVLDRADREEDPETAETWRSVLAEIDRVKSMNTMRSEEFKQSTATHIRSLSMMLTDLAQRRMVAIKVLSDRGILPRGLAE